MVRRATGAVAGREGTVLCGRDTDTGRGDARAPAGCLHRPAVVPPTGVGFGAECHKETRGGLQTCIKTNPWVIPPLSLSWGNRVHVQLDNHSISSQECKARNTGPNPDSKSYLDCVMCGN